MKVWMLNYTFFSVCEDFSASELQGEQRLLFALRGATVCSAVCVLRQGWAVPPHTHTHSLSALTWPCF